MLEKLGFNQISNEQIFEIFKEIDKSNDKNLSFVELAWFIKSLGIKNDQLNGNYDNPDTV